MDVELKGPEYRYLAGPEVIKLPPTTPPTPVVVIAPNGQSVHTLGPVPQLMKCPHCGLMMESRMERRVTKQTHLFAFGLCLTGLICLVPLPYCLKSCQNADHFCSQCNRFLGKADT